MLSTPRREACFTGDVGEEEEGGEGVFGGFEDDRVPGAARARATFQASMSGKFQGMTAPQTPRG